MRYISARGKRRLPQSTTYLVKVSVARLKLQTSNPGFASLSEKPFFLLIS